MTTPREQIREHLDRAEGSALMAGRYLAEVIGATENDIIGERYLGLSPEDFAEIAAAFAEIAAARVRILKALKRI